MINQFDSFIKNLQNQVFEDAKHAYGEIGFQRWRHPLYQGPMANPDAHARFKGQCGDTMEIYLKFENNRVKNASYVTDGCGASTVCGSFAAEMAIGRTPDELIEITGKSILQHIGRFPQEDQHCAYLAAEALQHALHAYLVNRATP